MQGTDSLDPYSDDYQAYVKPYVDYINSIAQDCLTPRVTMLRAQYTTEVEKGDREYAAAKQQTDAMIREAEEQVKTVLDMAKPRKHRSTSTPTQRPICARHKRNTTWPTPRSTP